MQLAVVAAGFTPGEADQLRRAMAVWRKRGSLGHFEDRLINGMRGRGYSADFAQQIFNQICGFGEYGFPESHAASFALLVYVSAWLKCHEPAAFTCALLNSQPMGFYAPSQLVQCAVRHGVEVRPVDIRYSDWDCTLEPRTAGELTLRLGLRMVKGLSAAGVERVLQARARQPFENVQDLFERASLDQGDLGALAAADALRGMAGHRHRARWQVAGAERPLPLLAGNSPVEGMPLLRRPREGQEIAADYNRVGLTLRRHPLEVLRPMLRKRGMLSAADVQSCADDELIYAAGLVINRQRPASAAGVVFVTLEDETGYLNLVIWQRVARAQRKALLGASLMGVRGTVQREGEVLHLVARELVDHSALLGELQARSRDFH